MSETNGEHLRAVGYGRTSGETQRDNTSIPNQKDDITHFVKSQNWTLTRFYVDECKSGAKIAGRDDFQQMMRDAANNRFDVIVVWDMSRFGRDGLDILNSAKTLKRDFGVDVVDTKGRFDTRDRRRTLTNFVDAGMAESERLSILERTKRGKIHKAREQGAPTGPRRPFARVWDKHTRTWSIDPDKHAIVKHAARRYLSGHPLSKVAKEVGINHAFLHKVLTQRCGPTWTQRVRCEELDIDEEIEIAVPRLLDDETIAAIRAKAQANKTINRDQLKNKYLLSHAVFCAHCNRALTGQTDQRNHRYYRHHHMCEDSNRPRSWVEADALERVIMETLFDVFGNPAKVQQAIDEATPNKEKLEQARHQQQRLEADKARIANQKERVIDAIAEDTIGKKEAKEKMVKLRAREQTLALELDKLAQLLENIPSAREVKEAADRIVRAATIAVANWHFDKMTWTEKRKLVQMVFTGKTADGKRHGVYISWIDGMEKKRRKEWRFRIVGRLNFTMNGKVHRDPVPVDSDWEPSWAPMQNELLDEVMKSASF
jgi:site-specific DNA recombinase